MLKMIRAFACTALLWCLQPTPARAALISLFASCNGSSQSLSQTVGVSAQQISCDNAGGTAMTSYNYAGAISSVSASFSDTNNSNPNTGAEAMLGARFEVTITNGTGSGRYQACLGGGFDRISQGISRITGTFGPEALLPITNPAIGPCDMPPSANGIPFTFGVTQIQTLNLDARASKLLSFPGSGGAGAFLSGFAVYDSNGNPLPDAMVNLVDVPGPVPEPGTIWLILPVLALYVARSIWRRPPAKVD